MPVLRLRWQAVEGTDDEVDPVSMPPLDGFVVCTEGRPETAPGEEVPFGDGAYQATCADNAPENVSIVGNQGYPG